MSLATTGLWTGSEEGGDRGLGGSVVGGGGGDDVYDVFKT